MLVYLHVRFGDDNVIVEGIEITETKAEKQQQKHKIIVITSTSITQSFLHMLCDAVHLLMFLTMCNALKNEFNFSMAIANSSQHSVDRWSAYGMSLQNAWAH